MVVSLKKKRDRSVHFILMRMPTSMGQRENESNNSLGVMSWYVAKRVLKIFDLQQQGVQETLVPSVKSDFQNGS
jgi:hypothetical protein